MTDNRYDNRRGIHEPRGGSNDRFDRSSRDDRGFFDRARDEVSSWFGDDDAERRRDREERAEGGRFGREQGYDSYERSPRYRDEGYRRPYTGRGGSRSGFGDDTDRPSGQGFGRGQDFERGASQREFGAMAASGLTGRTASSRHDSDYSQWRSRQIEELDRDYDEFRRENQSRFDSEFSTWRGQRQTKRQLLGQITEHMDVVGSDDLPVGKVDHIRRDKIILTKNDSADGRHHPINCTRIDRVEDNKVFLSATAEETQRGFTEDMRNRALFEKDDDDRDDGPHMLNRSFSGTY